MSTGMKIAKPGGNVNKKGDELYLDTNTPLLKVKELITGALDWDGTTASWDGDYTGTTSDNELFELAIPHNLGYPPVFLAYLDTKNARDRVYISSSASGVALDGDVAGYAIMEDNQLLLYIISNNMSGADTIPPLPGLYGYAIYIFHDEIGPRP